MRPHQFGLFCAIAIAAFSVTSVARAADAVVEPTIVYGVPPVAVDLPPVGYVLDPSDARRPIYVVNQGPTYSGPGIVTYAVPTYSEGGYAYALPYPYVRTYGGWYDYGRWHHRIYRPYGASLDAPYVYRPSVIRPYAAAYRYRVAPNARVIQLRDR
jgi:hypothetical protein